MHRGKIYTLGDRESGFIREIGVKEDIFFHSDALEGTTFGELKKGDKVLFQVEPSKKGPYAIHVTRDK
jgi:cold shock CspA family protein